MTLEIAAAAEQLFPHNLYVNYVCRFTKICKNMCRSPPDKCHYLKCYLCFKINNACDDFWFCLSQKVFINKRHLQQSFVEEILGLFKGIIGKLFHLTFYILKELSN